LRKASNSPSRSQITNNYLIEAS